MWLWMCVEERDRYMSLRNYPRETGKGEQRREKEDTGRGFYPEVDGSQKKANRTKCTSEGRQHFKNREQTWTCKKKKKNVCQVLDVLSNFKQLKYWPKSMKEEFSGRQEGASRDGEKGGEPQTATVGKGNADKATAEAGILGRPKRWATTGQSVGEKELQEDCSESAEGRSPWVSNWDLISTCSRKTAPRRRSRQNHLQRSPRVVGPA